MDFSESFVKSENKKQRKKKGGEDKGRRTSGLDRHAAVTVEHSKFLSHPTV